MACWKLRGSPKIDTPAVREAADAVAVIYEFSPVGGNLHIVLDDWNLEDRNLDFCETSIDENVHQADAEQLAAERKCLSLLRALTPGERASALAIHRKFIA